jgi:hypothetical protein
MHCIFAMWSETDVEFWLEGCAAIHAIMPVEIMQCIVEELLAGWLFSPVNPKDIQLVTSLDIWMASPWCWCFADWGNPCIFWQQGDEHYLPEIHASDAASWMAQRGEPGLSWYLCALRLPWMITSADLCCAEIPAHNIRDLPPRNLSCSRIQAW